MSLIDKAKSYFISLFISPLVSDKAGLVIRHFLTVLGGILTKQGADALAVQKIVEALVLGFSGLVSIAIGLVASTYNKKKAIRF